MKKGFTLSEVLITLSIIGVVAVITIPGTMRNYKNKLMVTQLETFYSRLSDAVQSEMNASHTDSFYETGVTKTSDDFAKFVKKYMKVAKANCNAECKVADFLTKNSGSGCSKLSSGAHICYTADKDPFYIGLDVNGTEQPDLPGRDIFYMTVREDGKIIDYDSSRAISANGTSPAACYNTTGSSIDDAKGCLNRVMQAGWKMEY